MRLIQDCCTWLPFCSIVALFLTLVQQVSSQREKNASLARFLHPPAPFSASELAFFESIFRFTYSPRDRSVGGKQKNPAMSKNPLPSYPSPTAATGELEIIIFSSSHIRFSTAELQTGCCKYPSYGGGCSFFSSATQRREHNSYCGTCTRKQVMRSALASLVMISDKTKSHFPKS